MEQWNAQATLGSTHWFYSKLVKTAENERWQITLFLMISINIFLKRLAGPQDHRCCWKRNAWNVLGNSLFTYIKQKLMDLHNLLLLQCICLVQSTAKFTTLLQLHQTCKIWTWRSPRYKNFQPLRPARTAKSMSSTVVLSFHPPASLIAAILHTPAVPGVHKILTRLTFMIGISITCSKCVKSSNIIPKY